MVPCTLEVFHNLPREHMPIVDRVPSKLFEPGQWGSLECFVAKSGMDVLLHVLLVLVCE